MMIGMDLGGDQMRAGKEYRTRDPYTSQKTTITRKTTNSLTCFSEAWPILWANERESQQNPLPCSKMKKYQDISMWLLICMDCFGRNSWEWSEETQRIRYELSGMEGKEVAPFALTYWRQMTGESGYPR